MSNAKLVKFEEVTPTLLRVVYFDGHLSELISHLNLPIYGAYDGLDEMVFAFLTLPSGRTVTLGEYANSPRTGVDLYVDSKMDSIPAVIYESCQQVGISKSQVVWFRDKFQAEIDQLFAERGNIQGIEKSNKNQEVIYNPIACFQHSLSIYDRAEFPEYWAMLQYNLGTAYYQAFKNGNGDQVNDLKVAIDSYEKSLEIYNPDEFPVRWEIGQKSLLEVKDLFIKYIDDYYHKISNAKTFSPTVTMVTKKAGAYSNEFENMVCSECQKLLAGVLQAPPHSPTRSKAFSKLVRHLQHLHYIIKVDHQNYELVLNQTWECLNREIDKFQRSSNGSSEQDLVRWINGYFKWRIRDLYFSQTNSSPILSLDDSIADTDKTYLNLLPQDEFRISGNEKDWDFTNTIKISSLIKYICNNGYRSRFNLRIYQTLGIEVDERQWLEAISTLIRTEKATEKLELVCPNCHEMIDSYIKYQDIPLDQTIRCTHCNHEFQVSEEHVVPMYSFSASFDPIQDLSILEEHTGSLVTKD